jgi:hypothetical protein
MRLFQNPYHLSGVVFAMLMTNAATLIWSGIVLSKTNTLMASGSRYAFVTTYINEDLLASIVGAIAILNIVCLVRHEKPSWLRNIGYGVLSLCWGFVFWWQVFGDGPIYATATALSGPMAFASLYAFLDGHLDRGDGDGPA